MGLETGTYISDLLPQNPPATDPRSQGADHLRLIKAVLKNTFPSLKGAVTLDQDTLNALPTSKQDTLGFTPVQQGGGPDQTNDKVAIGNNTGDQQVLRYSINGNDCGPLVSGRYGWVADAGDYPIFSIHWSGGSGRPIVGYGADISGGLTWPALALYSDIQTVQSNLTTEINRATDAESALYSDIQTVQNNLTTEINRATDAESALSSAKANLAGGNAFTGVQTVQGINAGKTDVYGGEIRSSFQDTNGFSHFGAYINAYGIRQIALGNYDGGEDYETWFLDNATRRMIMPDGAVSAVTSELPTAGTITGGTYTKTPMNDGTGRSVLVQSFYVANVSRNSIIAFPIAYPSGVTPTISVAFRDGGESSAWDNVMTLTNANCSFFLRYHVGATDGDSVGNIWITAQGIVS